MTFELRRKMIHDHYLYLHGAPPPSEWGESDERKEGLVAVISKELHIHKNSYNCTRRIMQEVYMNLFDGKEFDP